MQNTLHSRTFKIAVCSLGGLLVLLLVFQAGIAIGYRKGLFSSHWDSNYRLDADDPHSVFAPFMRGDEQMPNPHGTIGDIVSVDLPSLMVKGPNSPEEVVVLNPGTVLRELHSGATTTDLAPGRQVIVIGSPDDKGQIQAEFIRILPMGTSSQAVH